MTAYKTETDGQNIGLCVCHFLWFHVLVPSITEVSLEVIIEFGLHSTQDSVEITLSVAFLRLYTI